MNLAPHPFTLRQLQYAVAVADTLSFHRAAARCRVSQPSLSAQLAQLEGALGVQLFERDRRRVLPTAAGLQLIERARRILVEADDLIEESRRVGDPLAGTLRIGVIPTISPYLLPHLTPVLRERYPKLATLWIEDKTDVLVRRLAAGELDAAILALEADVGHVDHEVIAPDAFVLATPPGHPLGSSRKPATLAELKGTKVLLLDDGHCFRDQALSFCEKAGTEELEFRATSLPTLAQMVASGAGITLLPVLALDAEARPAGLRTRRFIDPAPHRTIALVWRPRSPLAGPLRQLAAAMRAAYPHERAGAQPATPPRPRRSRGRRAAR
ncbi:MAG TPA: LysR substrate-binding domain-containing protein [Kofleriaceae bacterium]|nr:LysR substrate-binding domain-containing protein [Kofleriaceae bacterium]